MPTYKETINLLSEFGVLPKGWCYGEGEALPSAKIEMAKLWVAFFRKAGFSRFNAFPGINDEIRMRVYHNDLMLDLLFETVKSTDITIRKGKEVLVYIESATVSEVKENVNNFINKLCLTSEPFTIDASTSRQMNSLQTSSEEEKKESLSSITNARLEQAIAFAFILAASTSLLQQRRRPTTLFRKKQSPPNAALSQKLPKVAMSATTTFSTGVKDIGAI